MTSSDNTYTPESDVTSSEVVSRAERLEEGVERKSPRNERKAVQQAMGGEFLPVARVGKLLTVDHWLLDYGKIYRAVRRGEISTADGAKLAYMATVGKQMAEARQQIIDQAQMIEELKRIREERVPALQLLAGPIEPEVKP